MTIFKDSQHFSRTLGDVWWQPFKDSHHFSRTSGDVWWQSLMTVFNGNATAFGKKLPWIYTVLRTSRTASFGSIRTWKRSCPKPPNPPWRPSSVANFSCTCHFVSVRKSNDVSWYHKHKCFVISCEDRPGDHHLIMENDIESHMQFTQFQIWSFLHHPTRVTSHLPQWVHPDWCLEWGLGIPKWAWCKPVGQGSIKNIWRKLQTQDGPFNVNRMYI